MLPLRRVGSGSRLLSEKQEGGIAPALVLTEKRAKIWLSARTPSAEDDRNCNALPQMQPVERRLPPS
jgi:hypothetical protein